jgi:hypothetical protein
MEERMELIERYLHQVGKYLPRKNREDILAEIKSHLEDTLDERTGGKPSDEDIFALLKETGSPQKMAASYAPQGQYLVGPALFPLWRMVTGIAIAATLGAQLLAWGISLWAGNGDIYAVELISGLLTSIPMTLGTVTIVFMILQSAGVKPHLEEKWDPRNLPEIKSGDDIKRGDLIAGIVFGILILAVFAVMPDKVGVYNFNSGTFFANPVILQYLPLIFLSMGVNIGLDIYLLWRGRWDMGSRAFQIGADLFSIVVLTLLYKGHTAWLIAHGSTGYFGDISRLATDFNTSYQLFGMECFQIAFGVALIVTVSVLISRFVKMIIRSLRAGKPEIYPAR